jgi:hypothetical protein
MHKISQAVTVFGAALLGILTLVRVATGLTVENRTVEQLATESQTIIHGVVQSSISRWEEKTIYTYTTVRVSETLKGNTPETITVKQMGGQVGEIGQEVSGTPRLIRNEEVVLFLVEWKGEYWIHSIVLGKFSVREEDGRKVAFNDLNNIGLVDPVTKEEITRPEKKKNHIPLQNLLGEIRSIVNR